MLLPHYTPLANVGRGLAPAITTTIMEYSQRKHTRLSYYNYSQPGCYYVTIHVQDASVCLSNIGMEDGQAKVQVTALGALATQQLFDLENRYPFVKIEKYVIMPTHIHSIFQLLPREAMRPGLTDIICTYKSMTTRIGNQALNTPGRKLFQTSFYETVLRNQRAYQ